VAPTRPVSSGRGAWQPGPAARVGAGAHAVIRGAVVSTTVTVAGCVSVLPAALRTRAQYSPASAKARGASVRVALVASARALVP
jgi:hypothetical protein